MEEYCQCEDPVFDEDDYCRVCGYIDLYAIEKEWDDFPDGWDDPEHYDYND